MTEKLIPATQLAEDVYCPYAWYLKQHGAEVSQETRLIQAIAWHEQQGRLLAAGDSIAGQHLPRSCLRLSLLLFLVGLVSMNLVLVLQRCFLFWLWCSLH